MNLAYNLEPVYSIAFAAVLFGKLSEKEKEAPLQSACQQSCQRDTASNKSEADAAAEMLKGLGTM